MNYRIILPPLNLQPFVKYFWVLENDSAEAQTVTFSPLADGCPGIMYQQPDKGIFHTADKLLPGIILYGQTIEPAKMTLTGTVSTVGICFQPHALQSVFGINAHELTSTCIDMGMLQHKKERRLQEQLLNASTTEEQIRLLSDSLLSSVQQTGDRKDAMISYAVGEILRGKGAVSLTALQQQTRLSERTLERRFKQSIGISAKLFSRICRFQEALTQLRKSNYQKLSDIAYENGYADQSHFIRSFKEFTGVSPFDYRVQLTEVAENFPVIK